MKNIRRIQRRRLNAGFTLSELLVSIAIIGVVSGLGLRTYFTAIEYYGLARSEGESDLAAQNALQTIRDDVSAVLPSSLTGVSIVGTVKKRGDVVDSDLVLPVSVPTFVDGRTAAAWVKYDVRRINDTVRLVRTAVPLHTKIPANAGTDVVAGVIAFNAKYLDEEGAWNDTWPTGSSPIAVRVSLTLKDSDSIAAPAITRSLLFRVPAR